MLLLFHCGMIYVFPFDGNIMEVGAIVVPPYFFSYLIGLESTIGCVEI